MTSMLERLAARSHPAPAPAYVEGDCMVWTGPCDRDGYGRIAIGARRRLLVHRAAWVERNGPIPPETPCVLHRCDVRACWRNAHLFLGTRADNQADMAAKGRGRGPGSRTKPREAVQS